MKKTLAVRIQYAQIPAAMPRRTKSLNPNGRPRGRKTKAKNITLNVDLVNAFTKVAFKEGRSFSNYVAEMLRERAAAQGIKIQYK